MKKQIRTVSIFLVIIFAGLILTSCFGNFQLTRKLYTWNSQVGDKFVNTAVMWVLMILPVYEACGFIDLFVLNTIEFWTGENPLAMNETDMDFKIVETGNKVYVIKATKNRFDITQIEGVNSGQSIAVVFDPENQQWLLISDSNTQVIAKLDKNILSLLYPDGKSNQIDLSK